MRTRLPSVLFLILWPGPAPALGQLSPEILADSHLLRAEQAIRDGDKDRARAEIDKILLLQKEHELDLVEEFHFRLAKAAGTTDLPEQALESVTKYLTAAGRDGLHYVEALELMNQMQDAIAAGKEPPPPSQVPIGAQSGVVGTPGIQTKQRDLLNTVKTRKAPLAPECDLTVWNTAIYFKTATVKDVKACIEAGADLNARDTRKNTPLLNAAMHNENPAVVQALLAAGADPNAQESYSYLHSAASSGNLAVVQALLAAGADPHARDWQKNTPLLNAARHNENPVVVQALLAAGADPHARDAISTPLHEAAGNNENPAVVQVLLAAGADPHARDWSKSTPLHRAASSGNPVVVQALLAAGADPHAREAQRESGGGAGAAGGGRCCRDNQCRCRGQQRPVRDPRLPPTCQCPEPGPFMVPCDGGFSGARLRAAGGWRPVRDRDGQLVDSGADPGQTSGDPGGM